jgi:hypothetical protein
LKGKEGLFDFDVTEEASSGIGEASEFLEQLANEK